MAAAKAQPKVPWLNSWRAFRTGRCRHETLAAPGRAPGEDVPLSTVGFGHAAAARISLRALTAAEPQRVEGGAGSGVVEATGPNLASCTVFP